MPKKIRCACGGQPACKLCGGAGKYDYDPGPRGYMPFKCPTCEGKKRLTDEDGASYPCITCQAQGYIDPANPPPAGMWDVLTKIFFGA